MAALPILHSLRKQDEDDDMDWPDDAPTPRLVPSCVEPFAAVVRRYPTLRLVIASAWRENFAFSDIRAAFLQDLARRIEGVTPIACEPIRYYRYHEVLEYLQSNGVADYPWIAVDEIQEHYPDDINIIITDPDIGFTEQDGVELEGRIMLALGLDPAGTAQSRAAMTGTPSIAATLEHKPRSRPWRKQ